jgi:hypothetical protein
MFEEKSQIGKPLLHELTNLEDSFPALPTSSLSRCSNRPASGVPISLSETLLDSEFL